jgi:murein L,D-transpeptidase YcbB/YkuD
VKSLLLLLGFASCVAVAPPALGVDQGTPIPAPSGLQPRLSSGTAAGEPLLRLRQLHLFYAERGQRPAWSDAGRLSPDIDTLLAALRSADREGLRPAEYHVAAIEGLLARLRPPGGAAAAGESAEAVDLDLLLSDAFFLFASHLTVGRVDPGSVEPAWNIAGRGRDLVFLLAAALENGHLPDTIAALPPTRVDYLLLRGALASQRAIAAAGGWPLVPLGPSLREGDDGPRVEALRSRLAATGELAAGESAGGGLFDAPLADALRRFQARHGLDADAVAGRLTLAALNVPAQRRVRQTEANLERLRWLPRDLGPRHLLVNVADFRLTLVEGGAPSLTMRIIAGREARRTPFFCGEITSIVLNPSWTVPAKIAVEDKLPLILDDPYYLEDHGFKVFARSGDGWHEVDPAAVDWARLSSSDFPYRLRQEPGPGNALGRIKFQLPNRHDIYLHDTPSHELFARSRRTFSSGCIRVERALDLAERLLAADKAWPRERIVATIAAEATVSVEVDAPLPVYLLYATAWVDRDGVLQLRDDVYGHDGKVLEALARPLSAEKP